MSKLQRRLFAVIANLQNQDDRGASLVEYALLVSLIAVVCIATVSMFGQSISVQASEFASAIDN